MEVRHSRSSNGIEKRSVNACVRCRRKKTKCSGNLPCSSCSRSGNACSFNDGTKKILVTTAFIQDLERRAERVSSALTDTEPVVPASIDERHQTDCDGVTHSNRVHTTSETLTRHDSARHEDDTLNFESTVSSPTTELINPLTLETDNYTTDYLGRRVHLGKSSNWAFARRVLRTVCTRLDLQIPVDRFYFEGCAYVLDWGPVSAGLSASNDETLLPSADYARHLVNIVRFHCGQLFHLFDEEMFMRRLDAFNDEEVARPRVPRIWYAHFLVVLALGKLFIAHTSQPLKPPGADLFLAAMRYWPELTFGAENVVECTEVLACLALYLQCLDFRTAAFTMMGQAVRKAFDQGLHTQICHRSPDSPVVQRCRRIWWTIYMLDRQMSTVVGLPQTIQESDITAPLPTFRTTKEEIGWKIHVKLSRVISDIAATVYGTDGRLPRRFLSSTKQALQNIAQITESLAVHIELPKPSSSGGISRFNAYLHLLNHQCICLTTRPLALCFLDRRLAVQSDHTQNLVLSGSAQVLLRMCIDSAQQMLQILTVLKTEGLLESFLPFDLEATFIATMVLTIAKTIDTHLLTDHKAWFNTSYMILDDMISRGNLVASARKRELQHLASILHRFWTTDAPSQPSSSPEPQSITQNGISNAVPTEENRRMTPPPMSNQFMGFGLQPDDLQFPGSTSWLDEMTAEQLREVAEQLDFDGFDWMTPSIESVN